jgi:hypothetical protein
MHENNSGKLVGAPECNKVLVPLNACGHLLRLNRKKESKAKGE